MYPSFFHLRNTKSDEALNQITTKQWCAKHHVISNHDLKSNHVFKSESWRAKHPLILDNKDLPRKIKRRGQVLTSRDLSLLVIDSLCDQDGGWNVAIGSYYFGFV